MPKKTNNSRSHDELANAIRFLSIDAVQKANSGHPGLPMGMADVATVLFTKFLKFDPSNPKWFDRDRFVLSAGHGSMLLYSLLYLTGYKDISIKDIKNFRQLKSKCAGHPEYGHISGIETTTGPLGQGFANSVGMALSERILANAFGKISDHFTYVIASDGDLMEGISHEAASLAGHLKLNKLIVFFDDNGISIDGPVSLANSENTINRFKSYQWNTLSIDGHNTSSIKKAIKSAQKSKKPTLISCRTKIGFGSPNKEGKSSAHGSPLGNDEIKLTRETLNWPNEPFEVPTKILNRWRACSKNGKANFKKWKTYFSKLSDKQKKEFNRRINGKIPTEAITALTNFKKHLIKDPISVATRQSSEMVINKISNLIPEFVGGSADLTGSNNTKAKDANIISATKYKGQYIYYGIREHAMAAIMNGMSLHQGIIPFGGTFLIFADYCKPSIRLSGLMEQRVIYVLTHDSIGLGEDGPTHQPIEQLASLRATPNVNVFRPADTYETVECWQHALVTKNTPSVLALTRQKLAPVRTKFSKENLSSFGAYELRNTSKNPLLTIFASGSEVNIALTVMSLMQKDKKSCRIISVPCFELFKKQSLAYQKKVKGNSKINISIEAGVKMGWNDICPKNTHNFSIESFGASAPYEELYKHFGLSAEKIYK
ncbi:transketolase, partial [Pelagibacteraceae bacterium]|nr:transketolase [Pelagibacteraceae bacterium]